MIRMLTTTYAESVISTPYMGLSALRRPITNGMTYIVRPRIEPRYSSVIVARISSGAIQWLVGPASASSRLQMNVRSSTRATSEGSDAHQKLSGFFSSRTKVPAATRSPVSCSYSAWLPSTQWTASGCVNSATSRTQARSRACVVGALSVSPAGEVSPSAGLRSVVTICASLDSVVVAPVVEGCLVGDPGADDDASPCTAPPAGSLH